MTFGDYAAVTFLIVVISTIMIAGWAAFTAPEGYQDREGWHPGREP